MNFSTELVCGVIGGAVAFLVCALVCPRLTAILQQGGYSCRRFLKWYYRKGNMQRQRLSLYALSLALLTALFSLCFSFLEAKWANLISVVPALLLLGVYVYADRKFALKVPLEGTPRVRRLLALQSVILLAVCIGAGIGLGAASYAVNRTWFYLLRFVPLSILPLLLPYILLFSDLVMSLYEIPHNRGFVRRAARALEESSCVKVGITGSFGKTSVKHYAEQMLGTKFRVTATPYSYNTPLGIARTVNERGLDCDIFLAEMGARKTGDIGELCSLVKPEYGIVTGICAQHLETFSTLGAIKREKGELARCAREVILGRTACDVFDGKALREGEDFEISSLECTTEGCSFCLKTGEERIGLSVKLLGRHAAEDVALAAMLCLKLGMTPEEISSAAESLSPVPHRLQKIEANGLNILDDSYNSNLEGAKNAVETLKLFGGRRYVVTPGLVEMGELEEEACGELGAALVGVEQVILVGETLVRAVQRGYTAAGGEESRLRIVPTLRDAQAILKAELSSGDTVLFLNDLPDIYR